MPVDDDPVVYAMREVFDGVPVTRVFHDPDGDWQYLTDSEPVPEAAVLAHRSHLFELDPSLLELASMPSGTWAVRHAPGHPWTCGEITDEDGDDSW
ncbi:hypothetical protein [Geodermatophilus sp. SYSU D01036]